MKYKNRVVYMYMPMPHVHVATYKYARWSQRTLAIGIAMAVLLSICGSANSSALALRSIDGTSPPHHHTRQWDRWRFLFVRNGGPRMISPLCMILQIEATNYSITLQEQRN